MSGDSQSGVESYLGETYGNSHFSWALYSVIPVIIGFFAIMVCVFYLR